ncbi:MAG: hypothetical protein ACQERU_10130, partial [Bacteroidota bacterium]
MKRIDIKCESRDEILQDDFNQPRKITSKTFYQYSLLILLIFELILHFYIPPNGSMIKLFLSLYIYISLVLLPLGNLNSIGNYFNNTTNFIFALIISYGLVVIITDVIKGQNIVSLFGNPVFGPVFLVPLFILWGSKINTLYWLHRISIFSIKLGIILAPIAFLLKMEELPYLAFFPTFFLILNYKYSSSKDKIWIILSLLIGLPVFYFSEYRTGIIRILFSLIVFGLIQLNFKIVYKYFAIIMICLPIYLLYTGVTANQNIIAQILHFGEEYDQTNLTVDTRTFLYTEFLTDMDKTQSLTFGKGAMGTYYSDFFYDWQGEDGDHYIRSIVEVGILQYMLRG